MHILQQIPGVGCEVALAQEAGVAAGVGAGALLQAAVAFLPLLPHPVTAEARAVILLL